MKIKSSAVCVALVMAFLDGCGATTSYKEIKNSEYVRATNTDFDRFIVSEPNVLQKYNKVVFPVLNLDDLEVEKKKPKIDRTWNLEKQDKKFYQDLFFAAIQDVYSNEPESGFIWTDKPGSDTLFANIKLVRLNPAVPNLAKGPGELSRELVSTMGELTVQITLVDSVTKKFVAAIEDGKDLNIAGSARTNLHKSNFKSAWKRTFIGWLNSLNKASDV